MKDVKFKHYFAVKNSKFIWEDGDMFLAKKRSLEGCRGFAIIEQVKEEISQNQYAYYFGGIIRSECMSSEQFAGWTESEIHQHLFSELRSYNKEVIYPDNKREVKTFVDDFSSYGKKDMSTYIEELIPHLNNEYEIFPKSSRYYSYNKYRPVNRRNRNEKAEKS